MPFGGDTYDPRRDRERLSRALADVRQAVSSGGWWTLRELSQRTGWPEASVSARLRDLRKKKFGGHTVERQYVADGIWRYRFISRKAASKLRSIALLFSVLVCTAAQAIPRGDHRKDEGWQEVTCALGSQVGGATSVCPDALGGCEYIDEGMHGRGSAPGPDACKTDDGYYPNGAREGDLFTSAGSTNESRILDYYWVAVNTIDSTYHPVWEDEFTPPDAEVDYYYTQTYGTLRWEGLPGWTYTAAFVQRLLNLTPPWPGGEQQIDLTLACGAQPSISWRSDSGQPLPSLVASDTAECRLSIREILMQDHEHESALRGASTVIGVRYRKPTPQRMGCGIGPELLLLALLPAARRKKACSGDSAFCSRS